MHESQAKLAQSTAGFRLNDNQTYRVVWEVLQALRSHDDRFDVMGGGALPITLGPFGMPRPDDSAFRRKLILSVMAMTSIREFKKSRHHDDGLRATAIFEHGEAERFSAAYEETATRRALVDCQRRERPLDPYIAKAASRSPCNSRFR